MHTINVDMKETQTYTDDIFHKYVFLPNKEKRKQADILTPESEFVKTKNTEAIPGCLSDLSAFFHF